MPTAELVDVLGMMGPVLRRNGREWFVRERMDAFGRPRTDGSGTWTGGAGRRMNR